MIFEHQVNVFWWITFDFVLYFKNINKQILGMFYKLKKFFFYNCLNLKKYKKTTTFF